MALKTDSDFSMDELVDLIEARGVSAYVQQTGGGTATIYMGDEMPELNCGDDDCPHYVLAAGPGVFSWNADEPSIGTFGDFCYGPDDHGDSGEYVLVTAMPLETLADNMVAEYRRRLAAI